LTTCFPRWEDDGVCGFIWEAVRAISRQGVDVRVIAMHSPGTPARECIGGVEVVRPRYWWPEDRELLRKEGGGLPATLRKYPLASLQIAPFALVHALAAVRCARDSDLIHAHWTLSAAAAQLGRWMHRRRVLATVHGSDIFQVTRHPVGAWLTSKVLRRCDRITAVSNALMEAAIAAGADRRKIQTISNGVDTRRFAPPRDGNRERVILYVGSFIERKGVKHLLAAMPEVLGALPHYRLALVGEGPQHAQLRQLADGLGVAERVDFLGFLPQDQVRSWMQRAQLFVLPSLEEAQGVVLLEALACGTPVVASQVDGIPEVITPDVGVLVPPADPAALAGAIRAALASSSRWADMSRCARERAVTVYDWNRIAQQFVVLYQSMI